FENTDRLCFYMNPKLAGEQLLVQDSYWLRPYPSYVWALIVLALLFAFLSIRDVSRPRIGRLRFIGELTLGFISMYYGSVLRADLLETKALRLPFASVSDVAKAVSSGRIRILLSEYQVQYSNFLAKPENSELAEAVETHPELSVGT